MRIRAIGRGNHEAGVVGGDVSSAKRERACRTPRRTHVLCIPHPRVTHLYVEHDTRHVHTQCPHSLTCEECPCIAQWIATRVSEKKAARPVTQPHRSTLSIRMPRNPRRDLQNRFLAIFLRVTRGNFRRVFESLQDGSIVSAQHVSDFPLFSTLKEFRIVSSFF